MSQEATIQDPRVTWEGCSVLLDINDGDRLVFARLSAGSTLKIGNNKCSLQPLIGCPFGSLFQVEHKSSGPYLSRVLSATQGNNVQEACTVKDESKDNRALVDDNKAQNLTGEDIDAMRRQGASGDEIIDALIANSSTFEKKTLFSQEKYKLKKQKKYAPKVLLRRPFARSICEAYFKKYPARIGYLRVDALSLLLSMANVSAHSDVLVVDMVGGLLTGAVAERLGGSGYTCNAYFGAAPYSMDIVRIFNLSDKICERIVQCPLTDLCSAPNGTAEQIGKHKGVCGMETQSNEHLSSHDSPAHASGIEQISLSSGNGMPDLTTYTIASAVAKPWKSAKAGESASKETISSWKKNGFSSLIVAAPDMDAWNIIRELLPLLSYSAPFTIYHQYLQPLATCMHNLQIGKMAIGMQISEPWLREYQVLPSRTHPCMQMSGFGGYILSGIKICDTESPLQ
ncbi:uncharacterized protein LOC131161407 [Malania oleifera]|uniref:uncharacterized protein LOC131161407 n=1 Tax=Malania oleifera TaxID=397392 RepID=UPI0025ADFAD8|nr:uncharacterized protein LOC131161407 [Malania oleifera]